MFLCYLFRDIPKIDVLLNLPKVKDALEKYPRKLVVNILRDILNVFRNKIKLGETLDLTLDNISNIFELELLKYNKGIRKVINATGVIIHTNLGRSKLCNEAIENIVNVAQNYTNLEYDLEKGSRGSRYSHVEKIICHILNCEAALVVNNNAAAIMLVLDTLCKNTEVIVSRGELVEIGGSFRIPEVMKFSGAILKEVGCTNRTHLHDYEEAITENTSCFLKVHTSNYYIDGFVKQVTIENLRELKEKYGKFIIEDIGSGTIIDLSKYGINSENNLVIDSLEKGADIVTFSGDKVLGGPQAGIIVGKKHLIEKMKKNNLLRALRVDKFTLAALESTFKCYFDENYAIESIPTLRMMLCKLDTLQQKANNFVDKIKKLEKIKVILQEDFSIIGGGSLPKERLKTYVIDIRHKNISTKKLEELLRSREIPIIVRVEKDSIKLDVRTIEQDEFNLIYEALSELECL